MSDWKYNPKTEGSGIICCIPQTGICPNKCSDCFFQSGRSYLEPLSENLPHIPPADMTNNRIVRMNDGNDSNFRRDLVEAVAGGYKNVFFNTSTPYELSKFPGPVVLTVNQGDMTNYEFYKVDTIPKNIMFVIVRVNTWNQVLLTLAVDYYTKREVRIVLTFIGYFIENIPEIEKPFYHWGKRTSNPYWVMNEDIQDNIMSSLKDNIYVYRCGYKGTYGCKFCGNCIREYYRVMEECRR